MSRRITLSDVAEHVGLSVSTVSFVLNDRPNSRIPEDTAKRVRAAAEELGYTADRQARGLKTGRSAALGFVSDEVTVTRYSSGMIRGILEVGEKREQAVVMSETGRREDRVSPVVRDMLARRVDGVILGLMQARELPADVVPALSGMPLVVLNGRIQGFPSVLPDEFVAGKQAVDHLVERGHRSIAVVGRSPDHRDPRFSVTVNRRFDGMDEAMRAAGLTFTVEVEGSGWEPDFGYLAGESIPTDGSVTAVVAGNDRIAFGVCQYLQAVGVSVPDDISVISFDDELLASYLRPGLTTLRLPYEDMGRVAADLLLDLVSGAHVPSPDADRPPEILVPMPLVERESVRAISPR